MIEIGPNLKEVILDFMAKNIGMAFTPGYRFKECFGELIKQAVKNEMKIITNTESETIKGSCTTSTVTILTHPIESGYYWLQSLKCPDDIKEWEICWFDLRHMTIELCSDDEVYSLGELGEADSLQYKFAQPVMPIKP